MGLFLDDSYLQQPAVDLIERVKLYAYSVSKYGNSPYIYPKWGLGGLPEGFSRRCAVHGGTFMLNMGEKEPFVEQVVYDGDGKVTGIKLGAEVAAAYEIPTEISCKQLIADPSYFHGTDKVKKTGQVVRCIAIFTEPIKGTNGADSCQMIIPAKQVAGRKSDIYVCVASWNHNIAAEGRYVAVMSAAVETGNPEAELAPALALLPPLQEKFSWVSDSYIPANDGSDNVFITTTYDATTHFQTCAEEVKAMYKAVTGTELDLTIPDEVDAQQ
jgi:Rab GDP dissociation inhibitor